MESEESKISVWVCREEKLVFGLSKRTACSDVVKVLLEDQDAQQHHGLSTASYFIVEKWRGFERILPNKTKLLRLWVAWGDEQSNVKFVLVKSDASLAVNHGARSAEARVVLSNKHCVTKATPLSPVAMGGIPPEKQRRVVRKAFRKLEKINKKKKRAHQQRDASSSSAAEKMETLVHVVISQDHTIRQQLQRITELDADIDSCEVKMHHDRMKTHGVNYVQDTYLVETERDGDEEVCSAETLVNFEEYVLRCEEVVRLQEELWEQEALMEIFTVQMQEELNHRWMQRRRREELSISSSPSLPCGTEEAASESENQKRLEEEEERIRTQLDASLYIGLRLNTDLEAIRSDLELSQEICAEREKEMRDLLEKVNTLDIQEGTERCDKMMGMMTSTLERKSEWVEQARGLSKAHSVNDDDDSDTGLSSLHSQDSDISQPVWESLV